jgi:hypothetical protein
VLRWAVELGRIDISTEVALLSDHLALLRMGHLKAVHHLLAYLNKNVTNRGFYLTSLTLFLLYILTIDQTCDLQLEEELLLKIPEPLRTPVTLRGAFVVANHAGIVLVMRRSHTGIMLFVQNSPMQWLSKRQNTV